MSRLSNGHRAGKALLLILLMSVVPQTGAALNVSIVAFDPGVPQDRSLHRDLKIFPRIREIEAMILPFVLRETLVQSGEWGAVRVVPEPEVAAELLVTGQIVHSDGDTLEIAIRAIDASGKVWLEKNFAGLMTESRCAKLYREIAEELKQAHAQQDAKSLDSIRAISMLRYAVQLAPSAFGEYLDTAADGTFTLARLPARNDPMLARIQKLRETEYVITDAVDAKFQELYADIASIYDLWRKYRRKTVEFEATNAAQAQATESSAPRGSYEALLNQYKNYQWDRVTAQEQDRLAVAFDNEVGPRIEAMETRIGELEGWVENKYATWHRLLEELFEAETSAEQAFEEDATDEINDLL